MARKIRYADFGSVSSGTMITEDVFDSCISMLESLNKRRAHAIRREWNNTAKECSEHTGDDCQNCAEHKSYLLNETLWDALNEYAAPYSYFGAHPGDGSDYGFWPSIDSLEDDARFTDEVLKVNDLSDVPRAYRGYVMLVNDHGNVTLFNKTRRGIREIWSCV